MKVLIIDNYDSFTYNLYQVSGELLMEKEKDFAIDVIRNDKITAQEIFKRKYNKIILSPGPGDPADINYFGVCKDVLLEIGKTISVFGVCLGMQGMAYYFGGKVIKAKLPMHGKTSLISHDGKGLFANVPQKIEVMRYHSLIADQNSLPECLEISAITGNLARNESKSQQSLSDGMEIMGLRHKKYPIEGVQFHPESFGTEAGKIILSNFLFKTKVSR